MPTITITREVIETMSGPELLRTFNELTGQSVKKFSDRKTGIARTIKALEATQNVVGGPRPAIVDGAVKVSAPAKAAPSKPSPKASKARRKRLELPARSAQKPHREGTNRAKLVQMLHRGATIEECMEKTGWDYRNTYEGIRILHTYLGYGLQEDEQGVIRLTV